MDKLLPGLIVAVVLAAILTVMWLGWRSRVRRDADLVVPEVPEGYVPVSSVDVLYVATTEGDRPLERLAVRGLGFRARAVLSIAPSGVVLAIPGERPSFIEATTLTSVAATNVAIDRVVESDGLIRIGWSIGGVPCDSYVRVVDADQLAVIADLERLLVPLPPAPTESESLS
ncbi:hypothetical protein CLV49_3121 [Labedella gwakjiensis]|uniref:PH domain-containing protein n=1 Tax=Labedella gwakjiensis TaxID=390269 RepID=A0A2P8GZT8_9MICO|nr:hypothetical protein [Labedella gwakjiensis]PSL39481.1 hypothetical protein CLV49_3121 [Labedella gwakjiensis]RUQ86118.1 hypothetical protein ELQ93_03650 [Labedella gwakjiensis]